MSLPTPPKVYKCLYLPRRQSIPDRPLLPWGQGKIGNNLQRILYHRHILYHVLIHIQKQFKLYPYIWLSNDELADFSNLAHFSLEATQGTQIAIFK